MRRDKSWDYSVQRTEVLEGDLIGVYKYLRGWDEEGARFLSTVLTGRTRDN